MVPLDQFSTNDLFLVGDGHQNIYGHHIVLSHLGIDIRGRGRRLRLNYRTPEETRRWASSVLKGVEINDLNGSIDTDRGYRSILSGPEPEFQPCDSFDDELKVIREWIEGIKKSNGEHVICVAARTNKERSEYASSLKAAGLSVHEITDKEHDIADPKPVRLSTMHRIKGLEFDHVCLAGLGNLEWDSMEESRREMEKCLLHVAATRTKNSVLVTAPKSLAT
jgi:superfamily I DNA/RNA helicase